VSTGRKRAALLAWLRVPHEPSAPTGDANVRVFRAAPHYFYYKALLWTLQKVAQLAALVTVFFFVPDVPFRGPSAIGLGPFTLTEWMMTAVFGALETVAFIGFVVQSAFSAALLRLDYEQRWYLVSDRSLRIREGLVFLSEKTMTFANVQHVAIRQNIVQRWLGIADVEVRTAGGGSGKKENPKADSDLHVGYLRGIDDAEAVRDVIRERMKRKQADPAASPAGDVRAALLPTGATTTSADASALAVLAEALHHEAHALRQALEAGPAGGA
jgi:membrane protein YdbS with pleckstrin-like domain